MPSKLLYLPPQAVAGQQQIVFSGPGFAPTAVDLRDPTAGNRLEISLTLGSLNLGEARQSAIIDFGAIRVLEWEFMAVMEYTVSVAEGGTLDCFIAPMPVSGLTQGPGGVNGATDALYIGTASSDVPNSIKQLQRVGAFTSTAEITPAVQVGKIGVYAALVRYGQLVVVNNTSSQHGDNVEMHIVANPVLPQGQDA